MKFSRALKTRIAIATAKELAHQFITSFMVRQGMILFASKLNYVAALEKARMDAITTTVGNAGKQYFFTGTQPAGPGTTHALTLVAGPFTLGTPFAPGATSAPPSVLSPTLPSNVNASSSNQATWSRVCTSAGDGSTNGIIDYSAGTSGCDITIGPTTSGQPVAITAASHSSATYAH
jgi:hypothetical protein